MPVPHLTARQCLPALLLMLTACLGACIAPPFAAPPPPEAVACSANCDELPPAEFNIPWGP